MPREPITDERHENLVKQLQTRIADRSYPGMISLPQGWTRIVEDMEKALNQTDPDYTIVQVKEKFGGLRFYTGSVLSFAGQLIVRWGESTSLRICERCGERGQSRGGSWMITLCDDCNQQDE